MAATATATAALSVSSSPMAMLIGSSSTRTTFHLTTTTTKLTMTRCSKNASTSTSFYSSQNNKIFEDRSAGIVCYRDENGEITCEGYDEGPRFHHKLFHYYNTPHTPTPTPTRDVEISQLLQRCWLQLTCEDDVGNSLMNS